ncbi:hypothetical protein IKF84_02645 [Candidatus Saccharibacteria bacterium]|nr:hypothetical protein [Candidatus Saccharibacteria bacterium]
MRKQRKGIIIASKRKLWPHELRVARILAAANHTVEFLEESSLHTADILLDGVEYEIKSPKSGTANSLEHLLKKALKQSPNIIIDTSRIKNLQDKAIRNFLRVQVKSRKQVKKMLMVDKKGRIVDISILV